MTTVGLPSIGGDFKLVDYNGKKVSLSDFKGKWLLIYFGFCNCPDVCPDQLEKIVMVVDRLGDFSLHFKHLKILH